MVAIPGEGLGSGAALMGLPFYVKIKQFVNNVQYGDPPKRSDATLKQLLHLVYNCK